MRAFLSLLFLSGFAFLASSQAEVTKIGNGDDGSDLEGFTEVKKGIIYESQKEAIELLQGLNIQGVPGLGALLPELKTSQMYITKKDSQTLEHTDSGAFHADMKGRVYARTFAEPHAATRFFPVAAKLDSDQLVALHIHEALHRSLPMSVREDESVVSSLTLAITTPGASFDHVQKMAMRLIPEASPQISPTAPLKYVDNGVPMPDTARAKNPSEFGFEFRSFSEPKQASNYRVSSMYLLKSDLYPFSIARRPIGFGIDLSLINRPTGALMGPLRLSTAARIWTFRGFDVGVWGLAGLNTLSNEELKQSQFGRDVYQLGISIKKDLDYFSVENFISYMFEGKSTQKIGNIDYQYEYGGVVQVSSHPAYLLGAFRLGAFLEFSLGDDYKVAGGAFTYDPGRYRLLSGGPEIQYRYQNLVFGLTGRFLINATQDASYDSLGDLMGPGVAQGYISGSVSVFF